MDFVSWRWKRGSSLVGMSSEKNLKLGGLKPARFCFTHGDQSVPSDSRPARGLAAVWREKHGPITLVFNRETAGIG